MNLVVLIREDDPVGAGILPPLVESARRVPLVPPAVFVDGLLEGFALPLDLGVPLCLGALDQGQDRVWCRRVLAKARDRIDVELAVLVKVMRRLDVPIGEMEVLLLDWRRGFVPEIVAAVVPVEIIDEAL